MNIVQFKEHIRSKNMKYVIIVSLTLYRLLYPYSSQNINNFYNSYYSSSKINFKKLFPNSVVREANTPLDVIVAFI